MCRLIPMSEWNGIQLHVSYVDDVLLSACAGASVSLPIEARKYLRALGEQGMLQFFVAVKVRESRQLFLKVWWAEYFHHR